MSATGYAELTCDGCGKSETVDLDGPDLLLGGGVTTIEQAVDGEGWSWYGNRLERLLCEECAEAEEARS